jgi:hypothetical protein
MHATATADVITAIDPVSVAWEKDHTAEQWAAIAAGIRAYAQGKNRQKYDSQDSCDTDGFLSQWAWGQLASEAHFAAQIADNHGLFDTRALIDADGTIVSYDHEESTEFRGSYSWVLDWAYARDKGISKFVRESNAKTAEKRMQAMEGKGFTVGLVRVRMGYYSPEGARRINGTTGFSKVPELLHRAEILDRRSLNAIGGEINGVQV